jgi:hypothetical protein
VVLLLGDYKIISDSPSNTAEQVREKERILTEAICKRRERYIKQADLWTSAFFGNESDENLYQNLVRHIIGEESQLTQDQVKQYLTLVEELTDEKRFFHWELEFPEVFFDETGIRKNNPGFDAVIGNPPYVNAIELNKILSDYEKPFWKEHFNSASGAYDLYILFLELGMKLTRGKGQSSLITPNKFLSAPYAVAFREYCCKSVKLRRVFNLSRIKVFKDPSVYPIVTIMENTSPDRQGR